MKKRVIKDKNKSIKKAKKVGRWLYWSPRVLSILFILFIALFSLDVFDSCNGFLGCAIALFMHNLPSLILIVFLIIAWKWEWVGALGFFLFAIWYVCTLFIKSLTNGFQGYYLSWSLIIAGPSFIAGILWWMNWKRKK